MKKKSQILILYLCHLEIQSYNYFKTTCYENILHSFIMSTSLYSYMECKVRSNNGIKLKHTLYLIHHLHTCNKNK